MKQSIIITIIDHNNASVDIPGRSEPFKLYCNNGRIQELINSFLRPINGLSRWKPILRGLDLNLDEDTISIDLKDIQSA